MTSPAETTAPREIRAQYAPGETVQLGDGPSTGATGYGQIILTAITYYPGHCYAVNASNQAAVITGSQATLRVGMFEGVNFDAQSSVLGDGSTTTTTLAVYKGVILKNATSVSTITAIGAKCYFENGEYVGNTAGTSPVAGQVLMITGGAGGDVLVDMTDRT
jgi:hypothetical protein